MNDIYRGSQGWQGYQGVIGYQGATGRGFQGFQGDFGEDGAQGFQGFQGVAGSGAQGFQGFQGGGGAQGATGTGNQGAQGFQGGGSALTTDTLVSSTGVALDFNGAPRKTLLLAHHTTLSVSNRGANKAFELFIEGDTGGAWNLAYDAAWKNVGGTGLPSIIGVGQVMKFRFDCLGNDAADVRIEYVNGAGVDYAFAASAAQSVHKSGTINFNPISGTMTGGPSRGYILKTLSVSVGTFTGSFGAYIVSQTLDVDSGRYTAVQWMAYAYQTSLQADYAVTWYPTQIAGIGQVCAGTLSWSIQDGIESASDNVSLVGYGADEVQQVQWQNMATPTAPVGGFFTLTLTGGTTGPIAAADGATAVQAAVTALLGANAPTVSGDTTTYTLTWSNGIYAHTDVAEVTLGGSTAPNVHDNSGNASFSFMKVIEGDGVSASDTYNGTWNASDVGTVTFDGVPFVRGSGGTVNIGGVIYGLSDLGTTFTLTSPDFVNRGTISASVSGIGIGLGVALGPVVSTTTQGNS